MTYTKKQFLEDVKAEATKLRDVARVSEIEKLDFETFTPFDQERCIYGQMTGDCTSYRASQLIMACCKRFVDMPQGDFAQLPTDTFEDMKPFINGEKPKGIRTIKGLQESRSEFIAHFSAIEAYILMPDANTEELIDFLKGNRKDLVL